MIMNAVEDIDSMMIDRSKLMADGAKYFELFEKHIPTGMSGNVLIMSIGNPDCLGKMMSLNKDAKYTVVENSRIIKCLSKLFDGVLDIEGIENDGLDLYNIIKELDMKFDCIIMNPPYRRNLHLKILAEAIKHLKDDGVCVNLSPCEWLIDTLNEVKKNSVFNTYKTSILKYLESFEIIDAIIGNQLFNIGLMTDLGIYACKKNCNAIDASKIKWLKINKQIFDKLIITTKQQFPDIVKYNETKHRFFVPLKLIANPYRTTAFNICTSTFQWLVDGKLPNGNAWQTGIYKSKSMNDTKQLYGLVFDDENSAKNFYNSTYTKCFKYANMLVKRFNQHVNVTYLPWLGDAINPRTGKKGYAGEWTNDDLYKFFNITPEEQKVIEETMEKYKQ